MAPTKPDSGLLTLVSNIDDIRNLTTCKICLRPFYEPFMLQCGHTFCYSCLRSWFCGGESRPKNKNCPHCRSAIKDVPAPNYALRDLAHIFVDRAELLTEGETLEEHETAKLIEAQLLASDREQTGPGLFQNIFEVPVATGGPIWDQEDHVHRCPQCNWELEEGYCEHCGYDDDPVFSDDSIGEDIDSVLGEEDEDGNTDDDVSSQGSISGFGQSLGHRPFRGSSVDAEDSDGNVNDVNGNLAAIDDDDNDHVDDNPFPWGYRPGHEELSSAAELDDENEDDDDDMQSFIDDGDHDIEIEVDYDSESAGIDNNNNWPSSSGQDRGRADFEIGRISHSSSRSSRSTATTMNDNDSDDDDGDDGATNYDESESDVLPPVPRQFRANRRVVLDDSEDGSEDEHHEDAVRKKLNGDEDDDNDDESHANSVRNNSGNEVEYDEEGEDGNEDVSRDIGDDNDHEEEEEEEEEEEDDDDIIDPFMASGRRRRHQGTAILRNSDSHRSASRSQSRHGYHPYARTHEAAAPNRSRLSQRQSSSRGRSQTTYVC